MNLCLKPIATSPPVTQPIIPRAYWNAQRGYTPFVWNDPSDESRINLSSRGLGMRTFGEDIFEDFLRSMGWSGWSGDIRCLRMGTDGGLEGGCCRCSLWRVRGWIG
ncbi:MAG: hypothetical protein ACT6FG_05330 [Methanosarcinaceae archaeon]